MLDLYIKRIIIHQFSPNDTELVLAESPIEITPRLDGKFSQDCPTLEGRICHF